MPSVIVETPSKGDAINAPLGADVRNAASVRVPFQSVGNRLKFLEDFYDVIKVLLLGGTLTPAAGVTWALSGGNLVFSGDGTYGVDLARALRGPATIEGTSGRVGRKVLALTADATINPLHYDTFFVDKAGSTAVLTIGAGPFVSGDWFDVVNESQTQLVTVTGLLSMVVSASSTRRTSARFVYDGAAWRISSYVQAF